jgi:hypothetical protein
MAATNKLFVEKQPFNDRVLFGLFGMVMLGLTGLMIQNILSQTANHWPLLLGIALLLAIGIGVRYLLQLRLKVSVGAKYFTYRLKPFHRHPQRIPLKEIACYQIIDRSALNAWSGGNIAFGNELVYSFIGRRGIFIETKDGKRFFFGVKDLQRLEDAMQQVLPQLAPARCGEE